MKKKWTKSIRNWEPTNERIITLDLKICGRNVINIVMYVPTDNIKVIEEFITRFQEENDTKNIFSLISCINLVINKTN